MRALARKLKHFVLNKLYPARKSGSELQFWKDELVRYEQWYLGELPFLYKTQSPKQGEKVAGPNLRVASVLTWHRLHQERKYLSDLELGRDSFAGRRVLDVGSGPIPSATCFSDAELYCLDPLLPQYVKAGFPFDCYGNVHFVAGCSEKMPLEDAFFDAVIAVNSIDHVDNIKKTAIEIQRVLKPGALLRLHVHYHRSTITEPLELNDRKIQDLFSWCPNFRKIAERFENFGGALPPDEKFVVWGNF